MGSKRSTGKEVGVRETFSVPEISCEHCKHSIEGALQPLGGVREATVHIDTRKVDVEWEDGSVTRDEIVGAIREAGYEVSA